MIRCVLVLAVLCISAGVVFADGGALLLHQRTGSVTVSVFGSPSPLRAGANDFSVLLQESETDTVLLDGSVDLELSKAGENRIEAKATPGQATNKLLYAVTVQIQEPGAWRLVTHFHVHGQDSSIRGQVVILGPEPALLSYWFYFALVPTAIAVFTLNQRLKSKRRSARLPIRP